MFTCFYRKQTEVCERVSNYLSLICKLKLSRTCQIGLVVLRINVDLAIFQPYLDLEAGDNQSLKIQVARPGIEPGPLAPQAKSLTTRPPLLLHVK